MQTHNIRTSDTTEISTADMPLHCPTDNAPLWNMHPRVYLALDEDNRARCPYCGAIYQLTGEHKAHH